MTYLNRSGGVFLFKVAGGIFFLSALLIFFYSILDLGQELVDGSGWLVRGCQGLHRVLHTLSTFQTLGNTPH